MHEHRADVLPSSQGGQSHGGVGLAALASEAVVVIGCRSGRVGSLFFQEHEGVGQALGVVVVEVSDRAATSLIEIVFGEEGGQGGNKYCRTGRSASAQRAITRPFSATSRAATSRRLRASERRPSSRRRPAHRRPAGARRVVSCRLREPSRARGSRSRPGVARPRG